jgi:hypothetical protein
LKIGSNGLTVIAGGLTTAATAAVVTVGVVDSVVSNADGDGAEVFITDKASAAGATGVLAVGTPSCGEDPTALGAPLDALAALARETPDTAPAKCFTTWGVSVVVLLMDPPGAVTRSAAPVVVSTSELTECAASLEV